MLHKFYAHIQLDILRYDCDFVGDINARAAAKGVHIGACNFRPFAL